MVKQVYKATKDNNNPPDDLNSTTNIGHNNDNGSTVNKNIVNKAPNNFQISERANETTTLAPNNDKDTSLAIDLFEKSHSHLQAK